MTEIQLERIGKDLAGMAGEPCYVEDIKGTVYLFGSELATLRCLQKYRDCKNARASYSVNRKEFYFSLETNI